ncbi:MAG: DUF2309 domain-containing protein [Bacteroidetes bacterium]|nr:DUF2309 domain-containing protein [Bacteroidota bacterium]
MKIQTPLFNEHEVLHQLKHYLPEQAALKDFIHQNTLQAFQKLKFHNALVKASEVFGYKVCFKLSEYRKLYENKQISPEILKRVIVYRKGVNAEAEWTEKLLSKKYDVPGLPRIGQLRANWKKQYQMDMDSLTQPILFRILCSYLDQGIAIWSFPYREKGFLGSLQEIEKFSATSFFRRKRAKDLLLKGACNISDLLKILIGDETLFGQYLFDQQFAHMGWSGIVSVVESNPATLLDNRKITLRDLIVFDLLLEIDALDFHFGEGKWQPLGSRIEEKPIDLFDEVHETELHQVLSLWQDAFEWSYYDQVLAGVIQVNKKSKTEKQNTKSFQSLFCIDDREDSLRRHLERLDSQCETFATPGFFSIEFFYQPEDGKFFTKVCPAPVTPKYLIKGSNSKEKREKDVHFSKHATSFYSGWLFSQTLGFWSALKLFINIFRPSIGPATASSFQHMDKYSELTIENKNLNDKEEGLQIGFTVPEMAQRLEGLLMSIGLVKDFAPIIYFVGHGASSVNNPHYSAYDCGACSGRPGSVNARVACYMANHPGVRAILKTKGIDIPAETQFMGALHDTTRDDIVFFDENSLSETNRALHHQNEKIFARALDDNSKERSRRFLSVDTHKPSAKVHEEVRRRSVSLFEPRPELNHATNALCVVARRDFSKRLFLDRRAFHNSYDYRIDPDGKYLLNILRPAAPVCGGINLEYFFSRVDNQKLGAGTKLPHNVMGLFGVANGIDGDLRPGLPSQMIEVHDPIRLLIIVEHFPLVVLDTIQRSPETYEWFINEWVHLAAVNPETYEVSIFKDGAFHPYQPLTSKVDSVTDVFALFESSHENLPILEIA